MSAGNDREFIDYLQAKEKVAHKLDTKVKCFKCGWEGTYKDCIFGHDDYVCPVCSVESLEEK